MARRKQKQLAEEKQKRSRESTSMMTLDFVWDVISVVFSLVDVVCDALVAYQFWKTGSMFFFKCSIAIFVVAQLSYTFLFVSTHESKTRKGCGLADTLHFFAIFCIAQFVPLLNWIEMVFQPTWLLDFYQAVGFKSIMKVQKKPKIYEDDDLTTQVEKLRAIIKMEITKHLGFLLEAFVEAIPQAVLQTVAIVTSSEWSWVSVFSIAMSVSVVASKGYLLSSSPHRPTFIFNCICVVTDCVGLFASYTLLYSGNRDIEENSYYMPLFKNLIKSIYIGIFCACIALSLGALTEFDWLNMRRLYNENRSAVCGRLCRTVMQYVMCAAIIILSILPVGVAIGIFKLSIVPILVFNAADIFLIHVFKSGGRSKEALFFTELRRYILSPWRPSVREEGRGGGCQFHCSTHSLVDLKLQMVNRYMALLDLYDKRLYQPIAKKPRLRINIRARKLTYSAPRPQIPSYAAYGNALHIAELTRPLGLMTTKNPFTASEIRRRVRWAWVRSIQPVMKQYAPGVHSALVSANIFYEESFSTHEWGQNDINVTTSGATADTNQSGSPPTSCRQSIHMNAVRIMTKFVAAHKEISSQHHLDDLVLRRVLPRLQVSFLASAVILWTFGIPLLMHAFVEWLKEIKQRHASFSVVVIPTYLAIVSLWFMAAVYFLRFNFLLLGFTMYSLFQPLWLVPTALNTLWVWKSNADIDEIPPGYDEMPPGYLPVPCEAFPVHPVAAVLTIMYALCFVVLTALIPLLWRWHLLGFDIAFRCLTWVPTYDARRKLFKKQLLENIAKFCDREIMRRRRNVAICHVTQVHGNLSSINRLIACFAHDGIADWTPDPKKMNN